MCSDECSFDMYIRPNAAQFSSHDAGANASTYVDCMQYSFHPERTTCVICETISYNWEPPLIILEDAGKRGACANDYLDKALDLIVGPAFCGYTAWREVGEFVEVKQEFEM